MKTLLLVCVVLASFLVYALFWPSRFEPAGWQAPTTEPPAVASQPMTHFVRLADNAGTGPETIAIGPHGRLYAGYADGTIRSFDPNRPSSEGKVFATTNGRPLGLAFGPAPPASKTHRQPAGTSPADQAAARAGRTHSAPAPADTTGRGTLYVADAEQGLLAINRDGEVSVLATAADGKALASTNDVAVAADGQIYFTDASSRWGRPDYRTAILEHHGDGRLLRYDPNSGQTTVLMHGLQYANGVALAADDRYILVAESGAYRLQRYWLKGPLAGQSEVFIDHLPGFPDGVDADRNGPGFWIALFAPRSPILDATAPHPWLRQIIYRLPRWAQPDPARQGHILRVDGNGHTTVNLIADGVDAYAPVTSVAATDQWLYLGSLEEQAIGRIPQPSTP